MDAPGRSCCVPKATRSPGKRWLPAHVLLSCSCPNPHGNPAPPSSPAQGKLLPTPLISRPFPAGRSCEATPGSSLSAPSPLPLGQGRRGLPSNPTDPLWGQHAPHPKPQKGTGQPGCPSPSPLGEQVICILYVKEILLSAAAAPLYSGNWSGINFGVAGSCWRSGDAAPIGCSSGPNRRDSPGYQGLCSSPLIRDGAAEKGSWSSLNFLLYLAGSAGCQRWMRRGGVGVGGGFVRALREVWGSLGHPCCGLVFPKVIPLFQRGCGLPGPPHVAGGRGRIFWLIFEMTAFPGGDCSSSGSRELEVEILGAGTPWFLFCFPVGSQDGAWPCFVLPPSPGRAAGRMSILPRFPQIPPSPQPLHPWLMFPSSPLVLLCSEAGRVAENFRSTHSLQLPSQSCPIPPHPCLASSRYSSQVSQRDKMKTQQISHGAGAGMQQRRALIGTGCSSS